MDIKSVAVVVTIVLAFIGYLVKYIFDIINYRREKKLDLINQRLNLFYGPLFFQTIAGERIQNNLLKEWGMEDKKEFLSDEHFEEWCLYVNEVLMPLNLKEEKIILENSYLIIEDDVPQCLIDFIIHISSFKAVAAKWKTGDFSEKFATSGYPEKLKEYISKSYENLKKEQLKLIGKKHAKNI